MSADEIEDSLDWHGVPNADDALDVILRLPVGDQPTALDRFTRPKWPSADHCLSAYRKAMGR